MILLLYPKGYKQNDSCFHGTDDHKTLTEIEAKFPRQVTESW